MFRGQQQQTLLGRTRGQPISPSHKDNGINDRGQMQIGYRPNRRLKGGLRPTGLSFILTSVAVTPPSSILIIKVREACSLQNL